MRPLVLLAAMTLVVLPPRMSAQAVRKTPEQLRVAYAAHQADFDYLLGDWEFTSVSKEYGKGRGFWSAVRLPDDGGAVVLDEYRVVGDSGETYYVTRTLRAYNANLDRWELVSTEGTTGLQNVGTGQRVGGEVRIEQRFGVGGPTPSLWRIRYHDIQPDRFSWTADRSTDEGRTWSTQHLVIEARRIGPRRTMGPLAPARQAVRGRP
jgi:hypothetical protein